MRPEFDGLDGLILAQRMLQWHALTTGPRVGDWIVMQDGTRRRFSHDWGDGLQVTCGDGDTGSFYLGGAYVSYSGSLDPMIPLEKIEPVKEMWLGNFWFFHHDSHRADNGVNARVLCRVYREMPDNAC